MGQPIYRCADPTGYFDQTEAWLDPGVLVHRWDFALRYPEGKVKGVRIPESFLKPFEKMSGRKWPRLITRSILPEGVDRRTVKVLREVSSRSRLVSLLLGSPAFQQQ